MHSLTDTSAYILQVLYQHTLGVLSDALALWPGVPVRVHYIDKLLSANQQQTVDPPPALLTGLQVMRRVLDAQVKPLEASPEACCHEKGRAQMSCGK